MTGDLSPSCEWERSCNFSENEPAAAATKESCSKNITAQLIN